MGRSYHRPARGQQEIGMIIVETAARGNRATETVRLGVSRVTRQPTGCNKRTLDEWYEQRAADRGPEWTAAEIRAEAEVEAGGDWRLDDLATQVRSTSVAEYVAGLIAEQS